MKADAREAAAARRGTGEGLSRRELLVAAGAAGTMALWLPAFRVAPADAAATCEPPPSFPQGIELFQQAYENWAQEIVVDALWVCAPRTPQDIVMVANWARAH